jgi:hypothetical protein
VSGRSSCRCLAAVAFAGVGLCCAPAFAHYHLVTWGLFPDGSSIPNNTTIDRQFNGWGARYYGDLLTVRDDTGVVMTGSNAAVLRNPTDIFQPPTTRLQYVFHFTDFPSVADFVAVTPIDAAAPGTTFTLSAWDSEDTLLGSMSRDVPATHQYLASEDTELVLFFPNMAYVTFSATAPAGSPVEVILGNLRYNHIVPAPAGAAALGAAGLLLTRRRRR